MNVQHNKGEYDRLKEELRRLKRAGAPWYFESELHRRLHGGHAHRSRLSAFPLNKAYVLTFVALASLAAAGYMMMMHVGLFAPQPGTEAVNGAAAPAESLHAPSPGPALERNAGPSPVPAGDVKASTLQRTTTSEALSDAPGGQTAGQRDSIRITNTARDVRATTAQDSGRREPTAPAVHAIIDSVTPTPVAVKDTARAHRDSTRGRKDTVITPPGALPAR